MNETKDKRLHDLNQQPDKTKYEVSFYLKKEGDLNLYETLHLDSSPELPREGDYVSFEFLADENGDEIFRKDGFVNQKEVGSDRKYDSLTTLSLKIDRIKTKYNKHLTEQNKYKTTVSKTVILVED